MKTLLHISCDYPSPLTPVTTRAIAYMVDPLHEYAQMIYAPTRIDGLPRGVKGLCTLPFADNKLGIVYRAPPKGIFLAKGLAPVADFILQDIAQRGLQVSGVHAHKFTIEGLVAQKVCEVLGVPLILTVQGNTDTKILGVKRGLRKRYQRIADQAAAILFFAPWAKTQFQKTLKIDEGKCYIYPVITPLDTLLASSVAQDERLMTLFRLDDYANKGLETLILALKRVLPSRPHVHLDVYGGGSARTLLEVRKLIKQQGMSENVHLCGSVPHEDVQATMGRYAAFVMPSKRESYGLVYLEALFSGVPILYSQGRGIDGYFDAKDVGYACNPFDVADVAKGMDHLLTHQADLKHCIATQQKVGDFTRFRKEPLLKAYRDILIKSLA
jgi:glycosyltransferase involved in cell wall biosynthesis